MNEIIDVTGALHLVPKNFTGMTIDRSKPTLKYQVWKDGEIEKVGRKPEDLVKALIWSTSKSRLSDSRYNIIEYEKGE